MEKEDIQSNPSNTNKRKKQYLTKPLKRKRYTLEPGLKGFLCSCNFREKDCIRESYNILNEYADELYGSAGNKGETIEEVANVEEEDIDGLLKEIQALKEMNESGKRFQVVESGAKNFLFIRTTVDDPVILAKNIIKDIHDNKKQKTRFLLRLVPVEATCKAYVEDIKTACEPLLEKYFKTTPKSFSIVFNHRNNSTVSKMEIIKAVADMVTAVRPDHVVDLKKAEISIVIEIIRNIALIGIVPYFVKYRKYNLHSIHENKKEVESDHK